MTFTGDKTSQVIQAVVALFTTALNNLERLLDAEPQSKEELAKANKEIEALKAQVADVDSSVSSSLSALLQPLVERTQKLNERVLGVPPSEVPPTEPTEGEEDELE